MVKETKTRSTKRSPDVVARDYTINMHKRLHGVYVLPHSLPFSDLYANPNSLPLEPSSVRLLERFGRSRYLHKRR